MTPDDAAQLAALMVLGLVGIAGAQLVVLWRAFGMWDAAKKGERFWQGQAAREANTASLARKELEELQARPSRLRVYEDTAGARARFNPPIRTEDVTDPIRTETEAPLPPVAEATTRELRPTGRAIGARRP